MSKLPKSGRSNHRRKVDTEFINNAFFEVHKKVNYRLKEKGDGTFASTHEALGIKVIEDYELEKAIHGRNREEIIEEIKDVAVTCIFWLACMEAGTMDW